MKTILLFPGIDAIESDQLRKDAIQWPEVKRRLQEAQAILDRLQVPITLEKVMLSKRTETLEWFSAMVLASMAVQVGIFDRYRNQGKPIDYLLGMSLGDLARSVCAGVSSFHATFIGLLQFIQRVSSVAGRGSTYQVKIQKQISDVDSFLQCKKFGVAISVYQSDTSFLVSGPIENLKRWSSEINQSQKGLSQELFSIPIPLHHHLLKDVATSIQPYIEKNAHFEKGTHSILSSVLVKQLTNEEELIKDINQNVYSPVKFSPLIHQIMKEDDSVNFVNIGPSVTLLAFMKQMDIPEGQYMLSNYFSLQSSNSK